MRLKSLWKRAVSLFIAVIIALPIPAMAQTDGIAPPQMALSNEELAQIVAPFALYPDSLLTQILMASTYPLEIVQADRWVQQHKSLEGDALATALEKESWDPSVKSMVNFPTVLAAMSQKLDQTTKLGDAFLSQEKDVMDTIQVLRRQAQASGNLKTTKEQTVVVEKETIIIEPASPQVIYVPTYSPAVVYGVWPYPAYPPNYYYPPPPPSYPVFSFAAGVAVGAAWGYAWGNSNWRGGNVNVNFNQNHNLNRHINRQSYSKHYQGGSGAWRHDQGHRKGVAYKDGGTARKYGQSPSRSSEARRDTRGYGDGSGYNRGNKGGGDRGSAARQDRSGGRGGRDSAFGGSGSGSRDRAASNRGHSSMGSSRGSGSSRGGGASRSSGRSSGGGGRSGGGGGGRR